jgi:hypothetical protein
MKKTSNATKTTGLNTPSKPFLPKWIMDNSYAQTLEDAAFSSGAALSVLHHTLADPILNVPHSLLRIRLALRASKNCLKIERRAVDEADIRDGFLLAYQNALNL